MAHLNFTPPPTPSDTLTNSELVDIAHPMRHVWRHRYTNSQSSLHYESSKPAAQTNELNDKKAKQLRHRRSTGMVIQKFDSTTSQRSFWSTAYMPELDRDIANPESEAFDSFDHHNSDFKSRRHSARRFYSVENIRENYTRPDTFVTQSHLTTPMTRPKTRPSPLNLTDSSQKKIKEKMDQRPAQPLLGMASEDQHTSASLDIDDEFSSVRDQITQITRELQQMQIEELQIQEKVFVDDRKQRQKLMEISQRDRIQQGRRLSISNTYQVEPINQNFHRHHRVRSDGSFFSHQQTPSLDTFVSSSSTDISLAQDSQLLSDSSIDHHFLSPRICDIQGRHIGDSGYRDIQSYNDENDDEQDNDDTIYQSLPASPNMTTLLLTTNSLITSRMEEMARSVSPHHLEEKMWQNDFVEVMTQCIHQSEELESLSTELLKVERQMRELFLLKSALEEQLEQTEYSYNNQIEQCHRALALQRQMINDLDYMMIDIDRKIDLNNQRLRRNELDQYDALRNLGDEVTVSNILGLTKKEELIARLRWEVGRFIGGGVGTGSIIHAYDSPDAGHSMIIGGTASSMETSLLNNSADPSLSSKRALAQHHQYVLHLSFEQWKVQFKKVPHERWVDDDLVDQCQFVRLDQVAPASRCPVQFNFFRRRHHCRRCGKIFCHEHSSNRILLFHPTEQSSQHEPSAGEWCRVCDKCFFNLVTVVVRPIASSVPPSL
ncbi:hypothetical protein K450DRAFT_284571 [Umbelopsis ramanniana AG]|uniref:FYVE-type domain-containing protein n=1 Tax=Umbelopsis ramanniana AG TaxID=1314678 RepID=A0AAD5HAI5_UMBRA|nr:uncharacterized protein K450DRAFT_284571 [Umbelopsis ramanniana AG]KAI8575178.1 hypothetical protein K450DRAFT_284571 [Umbelopsis ramanniana AG]